jgi:PAS domain S-box-containing protein
MIEIRTVIVGYIISNAICAMVITFLWQQNRRRFAGLGFWLVDFVFQFIALLLNVLRELIPDFLSVVVGNALIIGGTILLFIGLEKFVGQRRGQIYNIIFLTAFISVHSWFTFVYPSLEARNINLSLGLLIICSQCAWLMFRRTPLEMRAITNNLGVVFGLFCAVSVARIFIDLAIQADNDLFQSNVFDTALVLIYQFLFMILTFGLFLMVNHRLVAELEGDIIERKRMESALRSSEEKLLKAFHASPDVVLITRVSDGQMVEFNDSFTRLMGYTREEALGSSAIGLRLWANPADREVFIRLLQEQGNLHEVEYAFRSKSGNILNGLVSAESIVLGDEAHILSIIHDITRRKQRDEALRESRMVLEKLFEAEPDAVVAVNAEGRITQVNAQAETLFGYSRMELVNQPVEVLVPGALGGRHIQHRAGFRAHPQMRTMGSGLELACRRRDGSVFPVDIHLSPFETTAGWFTLAVVRDVTDRKALEASLRNRNEVLAALQQVMFDLVNRHEIEDLLQTLLEKIGAVLDAPQISFDLLQEQDVLVTLAVTAGQPLQKGDTMHRGEGGWLSWQAIETAWPAILEDYATWPQRRPLYEGFEIHAIMIIPIIQRGQVIGALNFSRSAANQPFSETDIYVAQQLAQMVALVMDNAQLYTQLQSELAERSQVQEALRESQENFRRYFNMTTVGMCVTSPERGWIEVNDHLCQMLGYSRAELGQLTWVDVTHPDDLDSDLVLFNQILSGERNSYQLDKRFVHKEGAIVSTTLYVSCHRNPDGNVAYLLAALVDISERKQAEEALQQAQTQLLEQQRAMAALDERQKLRRDLHDSVNQSIHSLVLFADTLAAMLETNQFERAKQLGEHLKESARQALKETRLMLYELQPHAVREDMDLVQELEWRLATVERHAGIKAQLTLKGNIAHCPAAWYESLYRITIEALNNALKHAQARNTQVLLRCTPRLLELSVTDDGLGFDPHRPHVGGLGLQNMRERAALLGGEVTITSTSGGGTSVHFQAKIKE